MVIHVKPLHKHDIVSVQFNYFYCMAICDKLNRDLALLTYIYIICGFLLINIFDAPTKVSTPKFA